jgi:hypothetical protein
MTIDVKDIIKKNPGMKNCQIWRMMGLEGVSKKQFITHYILNHDLYLHHEIRCTEAKYRPVKKDKVCISSLRSNDDIIRSLRRHVDMFTSNMKKYIYHQYHHERNAVSNTDIAQKLGLHGTTIGNHKDWFTWEIINAHLNEWKVKKLLYSDMTFEQRCHVNHQNNKKKYLIPQ